MHTECCSEGVLLLPMSKRHQHKQLLSNNHSKSMAVPYLFGCPYLRNFHRTLLRGPQRCP
eukprot:13580219-Heterocapsa_arctica.AAC.1